jgi:hypothetical protein
MPPPDKIGCISLLRGEQHEVPEKVLSPVSSRPLILLFHCRVKNKKGRILRVRYWEIIAINLSKAGWSWGCASALDSNARTIWIADAHRDDGKRFVVERKKS